MQSEKYIFVSLQIESDNILSTNFLLIWNQTEFCSEREKHKYISLSVFNILLAGQVYIYMYIHCGTFPPNMKVIKTKDLNKL